MIILINIEKMKINQSIVITAIVSLAVGALIIGFIDAHRPKPLFSKADSPCFADHTFCVRPPSEASCAEYGGTMVGTTTDAQGSGGNGPTYAICKWSDKGGTELLMSAE